MGRWVLIDKQTLVVIACSPADVHYQRGLVKDIQKKGAQVLTLSAKDKDYGANWNIQLPSYRNFAVLGIPFIFAPQMIALHKALQKGIDPGQPDGLDPYIELNTTER